MHGNVWEWCLDWYSSSGYSGTDPVGATSGNGRICRGGSYYRDASYCESGFRDYDDHDSRYSNLGFRVAVPADQIYGVTFNANGGEGTMSSQIYTYGVEQALSANAFTRFGYTFKGWAKSSTGSVVYTDGQSVKNLTSTGGTIYLYAIWEKVVSSNLEFTTSGDASWFINNSLTYNGQSVMQSGSITHNEETWLNTEVSNSGKISFYWKVSSESNYDTLKFYIDGVLKKTISGTGGSWQYVEFNISGTGTHTIRWCYAKDGSVSKGEDCGWIADVCWE
jgi:uncharacterized repeat protein (TIGR02543 family)